MLGWDILLFLEFRRFMKLLSITLLSISILGYSSYASFIDSLEEHEVNSCVEGRVVVGSVLTGGNGSLHVYTATGGQSVLDCIERFER